MREFVPYQRNAETFITRRNLPHWTQQGVTYYVTFRLDDSLPVERMHQLREEREVWKKQHPEPWSWAEIDEYDRLFHERLDAWLDAGHGQCLLSDPDAGDIIEGALKFFDGQRYLLDSYVIMPNHVHVLVAIEDPSTLSSVKHSWKSFTAHAINRHLGRKGTLWQDEAFDHIVRSVDHLNYYRAYISGNPGAAGLTRGFRIGSGIGVAEGCG